jgi:hypothetical protein
MFAAAAIVSLLSFVGSALSQAQLVDSYCATLSENDHYASDGIRLTDAASILRQDRANYHRFGVHDPGDGGEVIFRSPKDRERITALLDSGGADRAVLRAIVNGTPDVCVDIFPRFLTVFLTGPAVQGGSGAGAPSADEYPFVGEWDCEVAMFVFTPNVYNNGSEDLPILEIQEGSDGSYTLFFENDYLITLSGFTGDAMGWYSHASGDSFNCRRIH